MNAELLAKAIDTSKKADHKELRAVLRRVVNGQTVAEAFGSPGRWGSETPIGKALAARD